MAMVQGAVDDAVNAIDGGFEPYLVAPPAKRWYSTDAAAATAAYGVLVSLLPAQQAQLGVLYQASLDAIPDGRAKNGGIRVGEAAAAAMLAARADDGRFGPFRFPVGTEPGEWRPVLPAFVNDPNGWVARVTPFLIEGPEQFRSRGPHALTSRRYAKEFAEVKAIGSLTSASRSADQTDASRFWAENAVAMWSRIARQLSTERHLGSVDNARLFARLFLTGADAAIVCWEDKADWGFWRPITAIREAATDGNPATEADPEWLPLLNTPPYPDHPSGHNCLSSSVVSTLRDFFGTDKATFSATSATSGTSRSFTRFTQALDEIIDARVWSGIHFRTADEQGATIGKQVARYSRTHHFHPTH
ncbi:MAG: vanadium-dependent haloperoxidase [Acidimicrobiales bacterium]